VKFIEEFRDPQKIKRWVDALRSFEGLKATLMEVCGTHTMAIYRGGLPDLLPRNVRLLSGPGCPICVTTKGFIDAAIELSRMEGVTVVTFGDLLRVPGSEGSLESERARGSDIRVVYSTLEALNIARRLPERKVVFLGVGFETTAPTIAASILLARKEGLRNYSVLSAHKLIPPALRALAEGGEVHLDGLMLPGHVSTVIGERAYEFLPEEFGLPCVIAGFEPLDILQAVWMLLRQKASGHPVIERQYTRAVRREGNPRALEVMYRVFEPVDATWRGFGRVPESGLAIRPEFSDFDATRLFGISERPTEDDPRCLCASVVRGVKTPCDCPLFGGICTPESPVGACMVSSEGTCAAHYRYRGLQVSPGSNGHI